VPKDPLDLGDLVELLPDDLFPEGIDTEGLPSSIDDLSLNLVLSLLPKGTVPEDI
jgi:hypothetical protein